MIDLEGFRLYLLEDELSENTIHNYMDAMKQYMHQYDEVTKANAIEFKQSIMDKKPKTINSRISAIEKYAKFADIPNIKLKRVKVQKTSSVENVISVKQFNKLTQCLREENNEKWLTNVLVLAKTGARVSEAIRLTKADAIRGYAEMRTKGKVRKIYIPKSLKEDIWEYIKDFADTDTIIQGRFGSVTSRGVAQQLQNYAVRYNIPKEVMHPHSFRHFFAIEFLKRNKNISLLADLLGHSGVNTTMIYLRMSEKDQKREIDKAVNW